jgi:hypothetical protein
LRHTQIFSSLLVKTYPTISEKYSELVCTAGVLEDGSWIQLTLPHALWIKWNNGIARPKRNWPFLRKTFKTSVGDGRMQDKPTQKNLEIRGD